LDLANARFALEFKNGSRRHKEAKLGAKNNFRLVTSAATALATILELTLRFARGCFLRLTVPGRGR